jgi:hypothetical protein
MPHYKRQREDKAAPVQQLIVLLLLLLQHDQLLYKNTSSRPLSVINMLHSPAAVPAAGTNYLTSPTVTSC